MVVTCIIQCVAGDKLEVGTQNFTSDVNCPTINIHSLTGGLTPVVDTLSGLTDTTISGVADEQVLRYQSSSGKWINQTLADILPTPYYQACTTYGGAYDNYTIRRVSDSWETLLGLAATSPASQYPLSFPIVTGKHV